METVIYQVKEKTRLDKFLIKHLSGNTRSQIQKFIKDGQIKVNGKNVLPHHFLKKRDRITIEERKEEKVINGISEPEIMAETEDYLVINKLAGIAVHSGGGIKEKTLTDWLVEQYPEIKQVGDDLERPGIVHRLDKEVSGLLVVAKNQKMFDSLKNQFQSHQIKKEYLGLVQGVIKANDGQIDFPLKRSKLTGKMVAKPKESEGKNAITKFEVIKRFVNYTYLKIELLTGRTHQIRAHLQAYGHPLVGDKLYKNKKIKDKLNLKRIFLHATILGFYDLSNQWQEYQAKLPVDLTIILNSLNPSTFRQTQGAG